jgi:thiol:disulfide interchange protein
MHASFCPPRFQSILISILCVLAAPRIFAKESYATQSTAVNVSALQPGKKAVIAIVFDVKEGFHTQSNTPSKDSYVKFVVSLDDNAGFKASDPVYPPGENHDYPALGTLNVYTGKVTVFVPIEVKSDAAPGEIKITGKTRYQACDDKTCFFPMSLKFEIATKIVAASEAITATDAEVFRTYAPKGATTTSATTTSAPAVPQAPSAAPAPIKKSTEADWGGWFRKPLFVWPITAILVIMALGMFGLFTFRLPLGVYTIEPRHDTYLGNFLFGILTAVLSTPCTAPLFPALLAWAVLQAKNGGRFVGVGVIATVGVGMALPYLILSAFPELARKIPRTGAWSELVKQMMGVLIFGVAAYFAGQQLLNGNQFMWMVFAVAVAGGIFLVIRTRQLMPRPRPVFIAVVIALVMGSGTFALAQTLNRKSAVSWQHYSDAGLKAARDQKQLTLVKFTANWCANCQYIEATVYNDQEALRALSDDQVVMIKADLTRDGAPGTDLEESLNPGGGIPLTAIYSPAREKPYTLKSIYRTPTLLAALDAAKKGLPFNEDQDRSALWAFSIALAVGVIFNVMPCVLPVLPLKAIGFYEVSQHNRARSFSFGVVFSLGIIATFAALALLVLPVAGRG